MVVVLKPDSASESLGPFSNAEARAPPQAYDVRTLGMEPMYLEVFLISHPRKYKLPERVLSNMNSHSLLV